MSSADKLVHVNYSYTQYHLQSCLNARRPNLSTFRGVHWYVLSKGCLSISNFQTSSELRNRGCQTLASCIDHGHSYLTEYQIQENAEARWTRLVKTTYTDPLGVERTWESAERQVSLTIGFLFGSFCSLYKALFSALAQAACTPFDSTISHPGFGA